MGFARAQPILRAGDDYWWRISSTSDIPLVVGDIKDLVDQKIMPELLRFSSELNLMEMWETGSSPGLTENQRAISLAAFYRLRSMNHKILALRQELQRKVDSNVKVDLALKTINDFLSELG